MEQQNALPPGGNHNYLPAIVQRDLIDPTEYVALKAEMREDHGVIVTDMGITSGVHHFEVVNPPYDDDFDFPSDYPGFPYRVEYDIEHRTFRCSCPSGFYGKLKSNGLPVVCNHMLIVNDSLPWNE